MTMSLSLLDIAVAAVPLVIIVFTVVIGSKQAREFHGYTGDESLLAHVAAMSTFREGSGTSANAAQTQETARGRRAVRQVKAA